MPSKHLTEVNNLCDKKKNTQQNKNRRAINAST